MIPKILSVDDSRTIRLIVARALRPYECTMIEAANGEEGLAAVQRERPNLIVLDVTMPVMDGITMLTHMKQNPELKDIPVIMLTAEGALASRAYISELGVQDYLVKPFKEGELVEKIVRHFPLEKRPPAAPAAPAPGTAPAT